MKKLLYCLVVLWFSSASAGSYDDWFRSIRQDDAGAITNLLRRGFDPNTPGLDGVHGLYLALREESVKVANVLISWPKTNIEWRTPQDESPLMMASLRGNTELVRKLIARDADVNKPGWTPLHYAATSGHVKIIEMLLEAHAFIDAQSPNGTTPLMMAALYGTGDSVKLLIEAGADTQMRNQQGLTALDFAKRGERPDAIRMLSAARQPPQQKGKW